MRKIELHPITEWMEKDGDRFTGRIWLYCAGKLIGYCSPRGRKNGIEQYFFEENTESMPFLTAKGSIEEIKTEVELSLKEMITRYVKSFKTFTPVKK